MTVTLVLGTYWGDEGKAKVVDLLAGHYDAVVRFQGGANAGHTVVLGDNKYIFHCMPSGVLQPNKQNVIANGVVFSLASLSKEMDELKEKGITYNLFISDCAHITLPYHPILEQRDSAIGTTKRGIGPTYTSKTDRHGILLGYLKDHDLFLEQVERSLGRNKPDLDGLGVELDAKKIVEEQLAYFDRIKDCVTNTAYLLNDWLREGKNILLEGAQGALLDVCFGTYPFVTPSNTTAGGACTGTGIPPTAIKNVVAIHKAYPTRVGAGPFPTKMDDEMNEIVQERGGEFGATTGRRRDCGWPDFVAARYSAMINGVTSIALTKADVLDGIPRIKICEAYKDGDRTVTRFPASAHELTKCEPAYTSIEGWDNTSKATSYEELGDGLKKYIELIEQIAPVSIISTSADRKGTIIRRPELVFP